MAAMRHMPVDSVTVIAADRPSGLADRTRAAEYSCAAPITALGGGTGKMNWPLIRRPRAIDPSAAIHST